MYRIADINVTLDCNARTMNQAKKYLIKNCNTKSDLSIKTLDDSVIAESLSGSIITPIKKCYEKNIATHLAEGKSFYRKLISDFDGMMIHTSAVVFNNKAYLFSAPSGTGKSTHVNYWIKMLGKNAYILNDDKPAIRILTNNIYAYGTPWSGKNDLSNNSRAILSGICFLERDTNNWITDLSKQESFINLFFSSIRKINKTEMENLISTINVLINNIPMYKMGCTNSLEAAEISYRKMCKEQ